MAKARVGRDISSRSKEPYRRFSLPIRIGAQKPSAKLEFVTSPTWAGSSSLVEYHNAVVTFDPALAQL